MKRLLVLALLLSLPFPAPGAEADPFGQMGVVQPKQRLPAPAFALTDLDGRTVALADFSGKVVLINFWGTWCAPCAREMPALEALWQQYREQGLVVLGINVDRGNQKGVARFVRRLGLSFPVPLDSRGTVRKAYEVRRGLPLTYLIGRDGRFSGKVLGERDWRGEAAHALIGELLRSPPAE